MITIYNKIDKTMANTSGFQIVPEIDMLERPFLLCISSKNNLSKSIYGIMREGAQAARLQTTQGAAGRFILDDFPVDILGVRFQGDEEYHQSYTELADKFLYPFLTQRGMDVNRMIRQARKMNFFTYCEGAFTYKCAEERLEVLLKRAGIDDDDINAILSQISLVALESVVETGTLHATSVSFVDVNDIEIESEKTDSYRDLLLSQKRKAIYSPLGATNGVLYIYNGTGIHNVKKFFQDEECIAKPAVCSVVSMFLENSLENEIGGDFFPIEVPQIISRLNRFSDEALSSRNLLIKLDDALSYAGAPRYTNESAEVKMELDSVYKLLRKTNEMFIRTLNEKKGQEIRLNSVIRGIDEFSSNTTFEQILTYAHMWQPKEGKEVLSSPSDKQIRATVLGEEK